MKKKRMLITCLIWREGEGEMAGINLVSVAEESA